MFQRGRQRIREAYDDRFNRGPGNGREVTFHRVVNIVERRSSMQMMEGDFDRRVPDGPIYNEPMPYRDPRSCHGINNYSQNDNYPQNDMLYFENENHRFGNHGINPPPHRNEGHYNHNRDDLRHHLDSRNNGRGGAFFHNRSRDPAPHGREDTDFRRREQVTFRDRSPVRRVNSSSSSASRSSEKISSQTKSKPTAPASPPHGIPEEEPPQIPPTSKGIPPASVAEPDEKEKEEEEEEEEEAASMEPELTPEQVLKARRLEAIKAKVLEIEKDYRQDCETFRTVVKMLVEKEPSLDYLLQAPLDKNLEEIKERCLCSLKQFIKEMDEAKDLPSKTDQTTAGKT
ncbi:uncharacterized protein [Eucyclogobius newberryi]|uniref:uncharacterized protein n=1 Tax=Eucyclogobius newberryi TaxID=166745 RepID=UPI003B593395